MKLKWHRNHLEYSVHRKGFIYGLQFMNQRLLVTLA
jgi:hypothetical protein